MATYTGTAGDDSWVGTSGSDTADGLAGNDTLQGGGGNDLLIGGAGGDMLDGGSGIDTASYAAATSAVTIDFANLANNTGDAAGDTFVAVEIIQGTNYDDTFNSITSPVWNHTLQGGLGDDTYYVDTGGSIDVVIEQAGQGTDRVYTTALAFTIGANIEGLAYIGTGNFTGTGNAGANSLTGGDGNDVLIGGLGADVLDGGLGINTASYVNATSTLVINLANAALNTGEAAGDTYTNIQNVTGGAWNDTITGDAGDNVLVGGVGSDLLIGGAGADSLNGGTGGAGDTLDVASYANAGAEIVIDFETLANNGGDAAGDTYNGVEIFQGTDFNDTFNSITTVNWNTTLRGGKGDDTYYVDTGGSLDVVVENAGEGTDRVYTTAGAYTIAVNVEGLTYIGTGDFSGTGNAGANTITGGDGNDVLTGGAGADVLDGSWGSNTASYANAGSAVVVNLANAAVNTGDAAGDTYYSIQNVTGGAGNDTITGDAGDNVLIGGVGSDVLIGGAGADSMNGGTGGTGDTLDVASYATATAEIAIDFEHLVNNLGDAMGDTYNGVEIFQGSIYNDTFNSITTVNWNTTLRGGKGDDTYYVDTGGSSDVVVENAGEGTDRVYTTAGAYTIGANIEGLIYVGTGNFTGTGSSGVDSLTGGDGNDVLIGNAGADALDGGWGINTASYQNAGSVLVINLANSALNTGEAAGDTYTNIQNITGGAWNDTITGDAGDNVLIGGVGSDLLIGGAGADSLNGGTGGAGDTTDTTSYASAASSVGIDFETLANNWGDAAGDTYNGVEIFVGSNYDDTFNSITTANWNTTLKGGKGDDTYYVDTGGSLDVVVENAGEGTDRVYTTAGAWTLSGNVEALTYIGTGNFTGGGSSGVDSLTGGDGNDVLLGGLGADVLDGGGGVNTASYVNATASVIASLANPASNTGEAAGDTYANIQNLTGGASADTLTGDAGDNAFDGGNGADLFIGGGGADSYNGGSGLSDLSDTVSYANATSGITLDFANLANNTGEAEGDTFVAVENILGTAYADVFNSVTTVNWNHTMKGGAGDDTYYVDNGGDQVVELTGGGADTVCTTVAAYTVLANVEALTYVGTGNFTGTGDSGANIITGGVGNDVLIGGLGADTLDGGAGVNTASYANATTSIAASLLNPASNTGEASGDSYANIQNLIGGTSADTLTGDAGDNSLAGGVGADLLIGGAGADAFSGGGINDNGDTVSYASATSGVTVDFNNLANSTGDAAGDTFVAVEIIVGTAYDDVFNSITSVAWHHTLQGGQGDDTYYVDTGGSGDVVVEQAGQGTDRVYSSALAFTIGANIEALGFVGTGNFTGTGNAGANTLTGGDGNDVLIGAAGADTLDGGAGYNTASYAGATAGVVASLLDPTANTGDASGDLYGNIQSLTGSGFADTLTGDAGDNTITGGVGADLMIGGAGADSFSGAGSGTGYTLDVVSYAFSGGGVTIDFNNLANNTGDAAGDTYLAVEIFQGSAYNDTFNSITSSPWHTQLRGGAGDDTYYVDNSGSIEAITENTGEGNDSVFTNVATFTLGANLENLAYVGSGNFSGTGNAADNAITGAGGADTLVGGAGSDSLTGGNGADLYDFNALTETTVAAPDLIIDFVSGDHIDLSTIDADTTTTGNQAFHIDGTTGGAGDVDVWYDAALGVTVISLWVDNNASVDGVIYVVGNVSLTSGDFVL